MAQIPFSMPFKAPDSDPLVKMAEEHFDFGSVRAEMRNLPLNDSRTVSVKIVQSAETPPALTRWLWNPLKVTSALVTFLMFVIKALFRHNTNFVITDPTIITSLRKFLSSSS